MRKNVVIFYDDEPGFMEEDINILKENAFVVEVFSSAEELIKRVQSNPHNICLIVSELIVHGEGNNFHGRRKENFENCALYLLDEFDSLPEKDIISKIPKMIFTNWGHAQNEKFLLQMQKDLRVKKALKKRDSLPTSFILLVKSLVK